MPLFCGRDRGGSTLELHVGITFRLVSEFMFEVFADGLDTTSLTATNGRSAKSLTAAY